MKDIVLFGIQGSGKGTQGDLLVSQYGFHKFETGKTLRELASQNSDLGKRVKDVIETGALVSDDLIFDIMEDFLTKLPEDTAVIYDGVPRNAEQYERFVSTMEDYHRDFIVLHIDISEEEAIKRLSSRKVCPKCKKNYPYFYEKEECEDCHVPLIIRADDANIDSVQKRLLIYQEETTPLIELFESTGKLITIDGEHEIEEVYEDVETNLLSAQAIE